MIPKDIPKQWFLNFNVHMNYVTILFEEPYSEDSDKTPK